MTKNEDVQTKDEKYILSRTERETSYAATYTLNK
jgi:hypothetical protein